MGTGSRRPRPRPGAFFTPLVLCALWLTAVPCAARAQVKPVPDTTAKPDTTKPAAAGVPQDTTPGAPADSVAPQDTTPPAPFLPMPAALDTGAAAGVWTMDRDAIMRTGATTLTDLLQQVPGTLGFRLGYYGEPEVASALGAGGGSVEVLLDGVPLDPLEGPSDDLSRVSVANIESLRVQREPGRLIVDIRTIEPKSAKAYSLIEAQSGDPLALNVFRGYLLTHHFLIGPIGLGIERTASQGLAGNEPSNLFNGWLKWSVTGPSRGLQLEYHHASVTYGANAPFEGDVARSDLLLRARTVLPLPGAVAELYGASSSIGGGLAMDTALSASSRQLGVRIAYEHKRIAGLGAVRYRSGARLPRLEAEVRANVQVVPRARVWVDAQDAQWRGAHGTGALSGGVDLLGPLGLHLFAQASHGSYGVSTRPQRMLIDTSTTPAARLAGLRPLQDTLPPTDTVPPDTLPPADTLPHYAPLPPVPSVHRTGFRIGASWERHGVQLTAAALLFRTDSVFGFGLPFDSTTGAWPGGSARGFEVEGTVPVLWKVLHLEGDFTRWMGASSWTYLPQQEGHLALLLHAIPLASGNLEITARGQASYRGAMLVPSATGLTTLPATTVIDGYLQIRIETVRIFLRWENMTNPLNLADFPDRILPGTHIVYGVKWELHN